VSSQANVLSTLMAGGMSSRLFEEIREKRNLAYTVKGDADSKKNFAFSFIYVGTSKESVEKVRKLILFPPFQYIQNPAIKSAGFWFI